MAEFTQLKTDFKIPELLQKDIDALEEGVRNNVSYIDCLQDEVKGSSRVLGNEEQEEIIINYYCRRRWNNKRNAGEHEL